MRFKYAISERLRIEEMEQVMRDMLGIMCRSFGEGKPVGEHDVNLTIGQLEDLGVMP